MNGIEKVPEWRAELVRLLMEKSVRFGEFTLSSGRTSDFYVDVRQTSLSGRGGLLIGALLFHKLDHAKVKAVGGPLMGAAPLVTATTTYSAIIDEAIGSQARLNGFLIRKEPTKGHGISGWLVGTMGVPPGTKVAIVEDVTTTGGSMLKAIKRAQECRLEVVQCITVVNREEGAVAALKAEGFELEALVTRTNLEPAK